MLLTKKDIAKLDEAAEIFKAFGNPIRIRIIDALQERNLRVMELAKLLDYPQPIISQQLKILRGAGVVKKVMEERSYHYALTNPHYSFMVKCMKDCLSL